MLVESVEPKREVERKVTSLMLDVQKILDVYEIYLLILKHLFYVRHSSRCWR